ncbi:rhomboid family intramembrane serine protease [Georgenia faecalis]|uniref:Rhomboid family intramembrane serine protease n=1 Tax=Georgenia faecalis TaxID=2483799 RepID=A0ABV9D981_9MICO|nr:rhomboid family intramembrane serine protease [Georgenia faecalis]
MSEHPGGQTGAVPVCPRHPDTVSYVRCQRCGRPTCPACQRPAPVGIQCVDCVAQANAALPVRRTVLGGRDRGGRPVITMTLVGLCIAAYLVLALVPQLRGDLVFAPVVGDVQPYRFLTAAFLHSGFLHLAINMYALWVVGSVLEPALGRWRYLSLYLLSALGGSVGVLLLASPANDSWYTPVVGASGAVFGLFAAIALTMRRLGRDSTQILGLIAINAVIGFVVPNIAWQAHLGGLIVGGVLAAIYLYTPRRKLWISVVGTVGILAALVLLAFVAYGRV